jgi:hypothetical protein
MIFRVLAGRFVDKGKTYCKNDTVETNMDLIAMFGDLKFKREIELEMAKNSVPAQSPSPKEETPLGDDVTARYKAAKENKLRVFKDERDFFVAKEDETGVALNDNPLKRSEVVGFIEELVKKE